MRAQRPFVLVLSTFLVAGVVGCVSPYSGPSESLSMPKKKTPKPAGPAEEGTPLYGGLNEPDTCRTDFGGKEQALPRPPAVNRARSVAQDADNAMAGAERSAGAQRRNMVMDALALVNDALRIDPYSPLATYTMAKAYAFVGKKKCSLLMLERLAVLGQHPDLAADVGRIRTRAKTEVAFEPFRKEADGALGQ
jgi:hypothetical protein